LSFENVELNWSFFFQEKRLKVKRLLYQVQQNFRSKGAKERLVEETEVLGVRFCRCWRGAALIAVTSFGLESNFG